MSNPHQVTRDFEKALCDYTGAPFAVTVNSCTMALLLAVAWNLRGGTSCSVCGITAEQVERAGGHLCDRQPCGWQNIRKREIEIPKFTYCSVPMAIIHAGGRPTFRDEAWQGAYRLRPLQVWDSARRFTSGMFDNTYPRFDCVSFHASKILGDTQGGAILHNVEAADAWLRRARFDGRAEGVAPKDDTFTRIGWHAYLSPDVAARLLLKLAVLPKHNDPLPNDDYPDLSTMEIFQ